MPWNVTVSVVVAISPSACAVTVILPKTVPVGWTRPVPEPIDAMSNRSSVQLAVSGEVVPSLKVTFATSCSVGGLPGLLTARVAFAGVMERLWGAPWSAPLKGMTFPSPPSTLASGPQSFPQKVDPTSDEHDGKRTTRNAATAAASPRDRTMRVSLRHQTRLGWRRAR